MTVHVLNQLSLWVEGDLSTTDLAAVDGHLAECQACRAAAERLRTSQTWLREAMQPPFVSIDHENLRHAVMAQIRMEPAAKSVRHLAIRPALLAACAASLLVAILAWRQEHAPVASPPLVVPSVFPAEPATQTASMVPQSMACPDPARTAPLKVPLPGLEESSSSPAGGLPRIEFQTANPTVRIIWLAQANPLSETNPTPSEAP